MHYSKSFFMVMMILIIADAARGDTFYMRNGESFIAEIVSENPIEYKVKREGVLYSFIHETSTIKKQEIYALINVIGELVYPKNLRLSVTDNSLKSLPDNEIQKYYYIKQIEQQAEINQNMKRIKTILFIQLILAAGAGAAIAITQ